MSSPIGRAGDPDGIDAHPDLRALGRRLRMEMDEMLRAEQYAARVSARRRSTIRDRALLAEDRAEQLEVEVAGGSAISGLVLAVGADHLVIGGLSGTCWIALQHVVLLRTADR